MPAVDLNHITVAALCGSLGENSATVRALRLALASAAEVGVRTSLIELREYRLPFAGEPGAGDNPDVQRLAAELRGAHGILLGTPEYHGSFSGVLKNALDLMGFDEFQGKMLGLIGVGGGSIGAINALTHLRTVGRQLRAWVLPQQVSIGRSWEVFDADGNITDHELEARLQDMGREIARFSFLHSTTAEDFLRRWEQSAASASDA